MTYPSASHLVGDAGHVNDHNLLAAALPGLLKASDAGATYGLSVKAFGAVGDGVADDTAAIRAAVAAVSQTTQANGATLVFPAGRYKVTQTIDLGFIAGLAVEGVGRPGHSGTLGLTGSIIQYSGTGYAFTWATNTTSTQFYGVTFRNLHVQGVGTAPQGGIWLGNSGACVIDTCAVSEFRNGTTTGTGIRVGNDTSTGSQYNTIRDTYVSFCDIGIDVADSNGLRITGGTIEDIMPTPRAGTIGIRLRPGADTTIITAAVVQGFETLVDIGSGSNTCQGVRCEGFTTAYRITGNKNVITGGSINNSINGSTGTGILIDTTADATTVLVPTVSSVTTRLQNNGTKTTAIFDPDDVSRLAAVLEVVQTQNLRVNKSGAGAQSPQLTLESNGLVGPTLSAQAGFQQAVLDHAFTGATRLSLRVKGVEGIAVGDGKFGFGGANPITRPAVAGSRGGNVALANLLTALGTLGLITDSTTA